MLDDHAPGCLADNLMSEADGLYHLLGSVDDLLSGMNYGTGETRNHALERASPRLQGWLATTREESRAA